MTTKQLYNLRELVHSLDIPHPTIPEYVELHEKLQLILQEIDKIIDQDDLHL